jgi:hypothetical protein
MPDHRSGRQTRNVGGVLAQGDYAKIRVVQYKEIAVRLDAAGNLDGLARAIVEIQLGRTRGDGYLRHCGE